MNQIVVADLYQMQRVNGKFSHEHKTLSHPNQKVMLSYVEEVNANSVDSGKCYVINHEATKANEIERQEKLAALEIENEASKISAKDLLGAISKGVKAEKLEKSEKSVKTEPTVTENVLVNDAEKKTRAPRRAKQPD
jgi:hypothetical protein